MNQLALSSTTLRSTLDRLQNELIDQLTPDSHWVGELSSSALATATAISAISTALPHLPAAEQASLAPLVIRASGWLVDVQNPDGGWGDTPNSLSNIATTMLVIAASEIAERTAEENSGLFDAALPDWAAARSEAEAYVENVGGIPALRKRYGRDKTFAVPILMNYALAGQVDWKEVSALPFELTVFPQAWYRWLRLPVVSYAIPALVAVGQAIYFHRPPKNPIARILRHLAVGRSLNVLRNIQPASGGYLEAIPLTSFVAMSLASTGRANHPVVKDGLRFLKETIREEGSWPIDTNLATWVTSLAVHGLDGWSWCTGFSLPERGETRGSEKFDGGENVAQSSIDRNINANEYKSAMPDNAQGARSQAKACTPTPPTFDRVACIRWLLKCQHTERHPFTGAAPGGWGWSDLSGAVPDADDTPGAMLALRRLEENEADVPDELRSEIRGAVTLGCEWLLDLQNRDGGWPTFCKGWGKLPFDRSGCDLTAHVLRSIHAWRSDIISQRPELATRIQNADDRGWKYLQRTQNSDGSWTPLWFGNQFQQDEENPVYGTAKVLLAFANCGRVESDAARRATDYLLGCQSDAGGWGLKLSERNQQSNQPEAHHFKVPCDTVEETSLAVEALSSVGISFKNLAPANSSSDESEQIHQEMANRQQQILEACAKGVEWLEAAVNNDEHTSGSPIGLYFAKLWYYERMYPVTFATAALRAASFIL